MSNQRKSNKNSKTQTKRTNKSSSKSSKTQTKRASKSPRRSSTKPLNELMMKLPLTVLIATDYDDYDLLAMVYSFTGAHATITRCGDAISSMDIALDEQELAIGDGAFYEHAIIHRDHEDSKAVQSLVKKYEPKEEAKAFEVDNALVAVAEMRRALHTIEASLNITH